MEDPSSPDFDAHFDAGKQEDVHSLPRAFHLLAGRLLLFGTIAVVGAALDFSRGSINLYGLFGAYSFFRGWNFLKRKPRSWSNTLRLYEFICAVDCILMICFVLAFVLIPMVYLFNYDSGSRVPGHLGPLNINFNMDGTWLTVALGILTLPADFLFTRWAIKKLKSDEYRTYFANLKSRGRSHTGQGYSVSALVMWMTVFAAGLSIYVEDIKSNPYSRSWSSSSSSTRADGVGFKLVELPRRRLVPFAATSQTLVHFSLEESSSESRDSSWLSNHTRNSVLTIEGVKFIPPAHHNLAFIHDFEMESATVDFDKELLRNYLEVCMQGKVVPTISEFRAFIENPIADL